MADAWIAAIAADIAYGYNHACYRPGLDRIELPSAEQFIDRAALYARPWYDAAIRAEMALSPADRAIVRAAQELTHEADLAAVSAYRADGFVTFGGAL